VIRELREEAGDILLLEGGDFSDIPDAMGMYRTAVAFEAIKRMRFDAIILGEIEFSMSYARLVENLNALNTPVVSTNVFPKDKDITKPYVVLQKKGLKIAIVSALDTSRITRTDTLVIRESFEVLREIVSQLDEQCQFIVVLSHLGSHNSYEIADNFPQVDVIIDVHGSGDISENKRIGNSILVKVGSEGKWIGKLDLVIDSLGTIISYDGTQIGLGPEVEDDPDMIDLYLAYRDSVEKLEAGRLEVETEKPPVEFKDVKWGVKYCIYCHGEQFSSWLKTPHGKAFSSLEADNNHENKICLPCHTTGFSEGGFLSKDETPGLKNVQCESCHGIGSEHVKSEGKIKTVEITAETCTICHNTERDPDFDFAIEKSLVH